MRAIKTGAEYAIYQLGRHLPGMLAAAEGFTSRDGRSPWPIDRGSAARAFALLDDHMEATIRSAAEDLGAVLLPEGVRALVVVDPDYEVQNLARWRMLETLVQHENEAVRSAAARIRFELAEEVDGAGHQ